MNPAPPGIASPPARQRVPRWLLRLLVFVLAVQAAIYAGIGLGVGLTSAFAQQVVSLSAALLYFVISLVSPYFGLLFWLVMYPFAETSVNLSLGGGMPDLSPTRLVMAFLAVMLAAQIAIRKRAVPRLTHQDVWGLLFVAGIGVSAAAGANPVGAFKAVLDSYLAPLVFYFLAKQLVNTRRDIERLFDALLIIGGYSAFLAIHEQLTGVTWLLPDSAGIAVYTGGLRILRSLWGTNAVFGSIFALVIPIGFYRMIENRSLPGRLGYALLNLTFLVSMFYTYKRAAWIAMVVSLVILYLLYPASRRLLLVMAIVFAVPLALFWNRLARTSLVEDRITYQADSLNGRTDRWQVAVELWQQKPIFGQGFNQFDQLSGFIAIENQYLQILVSGGLVAFVPYAIFWLLVVLEGLDLYIRGPSLPGVFVNRAILAVFLAVVATYLVKGLSGVHSTPINLMFYVVVGAIVGSQSAQRRAARQARPAVAAGEATV